jgi:tight adherence protein B
VSAALPVLVPALLAAAGVAIGVGLPAPRRFLAAGGTGPRRRVPDPLLAVLVALVLVLPAGPVGAVVAGVLAVVARRALRAAREARALKAESTAAAEAMAVLAAELRAGRPAGVALTNAAAVALGPTATALAEAGSASGLGAAAADVLLAHAGSSSVPELIRGLAVCWQVCQGSGSSLASAVDRLEDGLRAEAECRDEVQAELAGPRSTALMLAVLPGFGLLLGSGLGADPLRFLLRTPLGGGCLAVGVALELLGVWWTGRIVRAAAGSP